MFTTLGLSEGEPAAPVGCSFDTPPPHQDPELFTLFGTTFRGSQVIHTPASDDAKPHFKRSLIAAAIAPPLVLLPFLAIDITLPEALVLVAPLAYAGWSIYWGFVSIGNLMLKEDELSPGWARVLRAVARFLGKHPAGAAVVVVAYSMFGGGVHEFRKYRRIVSSVSVDLQ